MTDKWRLVSGGEEIRDEARSQAIDDCIEVVREALAQHEGLYTGVCLEAVASRLEALKASNTEGANVMTERRYVFVVTDNGAPDCVYCDADRAEATRAAFEQRNPDRVFKTTRFVISDTVSPPRSE